MTKLIEISQLLNTPDQTYINGAVEGYLVQIRPPFKEGAPGKAKLQDGGQTIDVSLWGQGFSHWEGQRVRFSGKGMKITEYKGEKQLSVGDKVSVESAAADAIPGDPAPAQPAQHHPSPVKPSSSTGQSSTFNVGNPPTPVHGATVGGALARAVEVAIAMNRPDDLTLIEKHMHAFIAMSLRAETGAKPTQNQWVTPDEEPIPF